MAVETKEPICLCPRYTPARCKYVIAETDELALWAVWSWASLLSVLFFFLSFPSVPLVLFCGLRLAPLCGR